MLADLFTLGWTDDKSIIQGNICLVVPMFCLYISHSKKDRLMVMGKNVKAISESQNILF